MTSSLDSNGNLLATPTTVSYQQLVETGAVLLNMCVDGKSVGDLYQFLSNRTCTYGPAARFRYCQSTVMHKDLRHMSQFLHNHVQTFVKSSPL